MFTMTWKGYALECIPTHTIGILARHTMANGFSQVCFWLSAELAERLFPTGVLHSAIGILEGVGLILLMCLLLIDMFRELVRGV